ncbi:MAG: hypothetical protein ACI9HK_002311, partial [Pirellulaceae bacterium]
AGRELAGRELAGRVLAGRVLAAQGRPGAAAQAVPEAADLAVFGWAASWNWVCSSQNSTTSPLFSLGAFVVGNTGAVFRKVNIGAPSVKSTSLAIERQARSLDRS